MGVEQRKKELFAKIFILLAQSVLGIWSFQNWTFVRDRFCQGSVLSFCGILNNFWYFLSNIADSGNALHVSSLLGLRARA